MKPSVLFFLFALLVIGTSVPADDLSDRPSLSSPDKLFTVAFIDRHTFTIQDSRGAAIFSSITIPRFRDLAEFRPEHVSWSPDSQVLAIAGGDGHSLETLILVRRGKSFFPVAVPNLTDRYDNPFVTPAKWIKGRRLVLHISGPHAGKANGYDYKGSATIRVSITPPVCEVLYNKIVEHSDESDRIEGQDK